MWNEEKSIAKTIESMFASDYPEDKYEVIVVDNNSKDESIKIAKGLKEKYPKLKIFSEKRQGKGCAINRGIKESRSEIVFTMDADTIVSSDAIKKMVRYFKDNQVMSVCPTMLIYKPKTIFQKIQQIEYLFGIFLRKVFGSIDAIHVTPGAFSAYRKSFFDKHGLYDEGNITEDFEIALRIQSLGYRIEYSIDSKVYTIAPPKFKPLLVQRRRWYTGTMKNTWNYRKLISRKYGDMGIFILPLAWFCIFMSVFILNYTIIKTILNIKDEFLFLSSINFDFANAYSISRFSLEKFLFIFFSNPISLFSILFLLTLSGFMYYAVKKAGSPKGIYISTIFYLIFYSIMFGFWWTVSIIYITFNKKVKWR